MLTQAQAERLAAELVQAKRDGALIINGEDYLEGIARYGANLGWHCDPERPSNLVVDSDGSIMSCQDWWGDECKALNVLDPDFSLDRWAAAFDTDVRRCVGCYWNCTAHAESALTSLNQGAQ
jgi:hypothetical protein